MTIGWPVTPEPTRPRRDLRHVDVAKSLHRTTDLRHNGVVKNVRSAGSAKGDGPTRGQVARLILELGPSTAATLGSRLGLTPAAIRRHLDNLLAETAGPEAVAEFARRQLADLERRYAPVVAHGELGVRVQALAEALSADGYAASAGPAPAVGLGSGGMAGEQLCQHHCPVAHVAAEFPQLCEAETEAFGRLLGTPVQRLATIAHGDGICTTHVTHVTGAGKTALAKTVVKHGV